MDERGPAGILAGTHAGEQGRDTGADVLAHDDGDGGAEADGPGHAQGLQNTHGGRGGLDDGGQGRTGQHTQDGVGEGGENAGELLVLGQGGDGGAHGLHAEHQNGEAHENGADVFLPVVLLGGHGENDTDGGENRGEGAGLQKFQEQIAALNAC